MHQQNNMGHVSAYQPESPQPDFVGQERPQVNLLKVIWKRQGIVWFSILIAMVGALAFLIKATPKYTSTAQIYVEQNTPQLLSDQQGTTTQSDSYLYTQAELLRSQPIISAALEAPGISGLHVFDKVDNALVFLKRELDVSVGKKDDIISVSLQSASAEESAAVVNSIVAAYVDFQMKHKKTTAAEMLRILQNEQVKREAEYEKQMADLVGYKQANAEVFYETEKGGNIVIQDLANISSQLQQARLNRQAAKGRLDILDNKVTAQKVYEDARQVEEEFDKVYQQQQQKASVITAKKAEFSKMQSEADRTEKNLDMLDTRMKELSVVEDSGPLNINILEQARAEDIPTFPRKSLTMAAALMLGTMLGIGLALLRDWMDQRIQSADEVTELLGLSVLGIVPTMGSGKVVGSAGRRVELEPSSAIAESFRSLRTALYFGVPDRSKKSILITSPTPGDGKSTTASNLAIALAQAGQRVLLVDADMRKPMQHRIFNLNNEKGLSGVIAGKYQVHEAIAQVGVEGLAVLPAGMIPPNPSELLNSQAFMQLAEKLSSEYDQIIIDSPPVLAVADARVLGAICDLTVLVLRADKSTRKAGEHAAERLRNVGSRLLGAIVNDVQSGKGGYYYSGYEQYYQYGYSESKIIDAPVRSKRALTSKNA